MMSVVGSIMVPHPPIILPEVGKGEEKKISLTDEAFRKAAAFVGALKPETIVLLSPHSVMYTDYFHISPGKGAKGDMRQFRAPQVKIQVDYDTEFVRKLIDIARQAAFPAGTMGERNPDLDHGTLIPLYYVNQYCTEYQLVRIGLSGLPLTDHYRLGQMIQQTAGLLNRRIVIIGSGDLSHKLREDGPYGLSEEGPKYDERIIPTGETLDAEEYRRGVPAAHRVISELMDMGKSGGTAVLEDQKQGGRIVYEAGEGYRYWMLFNHGGEKGYICPEPQTWIVDAPNRPLPPEVTGFDAIEPGDCRVLKANMRFEWF